MNSVENVFLYSWLKIQLVTIVDTVGYCIGSCYLNYACRNWNCYLSTTLFSFRIGIFKVAKRGNFISSNFRFGYTDQVALCILRHTLKMINGFEYTKYIGWWQEIDVVDEKNLSSTWFVTNMICQQQILKPATLSFEKYVYSYLRSSPFTQLWLFLFM